MSEDERMIKKIVVIALLFCMSSTVYAVEKKVESPLSKFSFSTQHVKTIAFTPTSHLKTSFSMLIRKGDDLVVNGIIVRTSFRAIVINCIDRTFMTVHTLTVDDKKDTISEQTFFDNNWVKPGDHSFNELEVETVCNEGTGQDL